MAGAETDRGNGIVRILAADDDPTSLRLLAKPLTAAGMQVQTVDSGTAFLNRVDETFDVVLLDLWMPDIDGIQCIRKLRERGLNLPCIVVTAERAPERVVEAMKAGAFHYLTKPFPPDEVVLLIRQAVQSRRLAAENESLRAALQTAGDDTWISGSDAGRKILAQVDKVADSNAPVLITGETGSGKSLLARMLHARSPRAARPFVTVSCGAIPRDLLESELFGHERGAFTGALRDRPGRVELAGDGTLFLDEIGDLPLLMQPKVLRALQEWEYERIGGSRTHRVEARVIAATNVDLHAAVADGRFRRDLFYRLAVLRLHIPPLRERPEDIVGLAELFLARGARAGQPSRKLDDSARQALLAHGWPGNARELQSVMERAMIFTEGPEIGATDLDFELSASEKAPRSAAPSEPLAGLTLEQIERLAYTRALEVAGGHVAPAARQLGVSVKTVYNRMRALGIPRNAESASGAET